LLGGQFLNNLLIGLPLLVVHVGVLENLSDGVFDLQLGIDDPDSPFCVEDEVLLVALQ
jgi:hypothetical protein